MQSGNILIITFFCTFLFAFSSAAQDFTQYGWNESEIKKAQTTTEADFMTKEEKDVIFYTNLARIKPTKFANSIQEIYKNHGDDRFSDLDNLQNNKWFKSLLKDLKQMQPAPALHPNKNLYEAALSHAKDLGKNGTTGHKSSDGTPFAKRLNKYANCQSLSENCSYGLKEGFEIALQFLIDTKVKNLAHRKNSLNENYDQVGVAIEPHQEYSYNCVMDFGGGCK